MYTISSRILLLLLSITGGGVSRIENNMPISLDGSTFISTSSTGTICEVAGRGVLFLAWIDISAANTSGTINITFDGGVSSLRSSRGNDSSGCAGYQSYDLFVAGDKWLPASGNLRTYGDISFGGMRTADDFRQGFNVVGPYSQAVCASQHGLVFENGLKIECSGNISKAQVIYKLLD